MRDPERIDLFLKKFGELWKEVPDWRFGQLVDNVMDFAEHEGAPNIFYIEEDDFQYYMDRFFKEGDE